MDSLYRNMKQVEDNDRLTHQPSSLLDAGHKGGPQHVANAMRLCLFVRNDTGHSREPGQAG
eukprot:4480317-Pleurochrysis_carterae.AAC.1